MEPPPAPPPKGDNDEGAPPTGNNRTGGNRLKTAYIKGFDYRSMLISHKVKGGGNRCLFRKNFSALKSSIYML